MGEPEVERRRPRWTRVVATVGAVAVVAAGVAVVAWSPLFRVRTIVVRGTAHLSPAAVLRTIGVAEGASLLRFDAGRAEARLEAHPWIVDAVVTKDPPSTLEIRVREQRPVATTELRGRPHLVGADGALLGSGRTLSGRGTQLPTIGAEDAALVAGARRAAARALAAMPPGVRSHVREVVVLAAGELVIGLRSGASVLYGPAADLVAKGRALRGVVRWATRGDVGLEQVDVRVPAAPTARLIGGTVVAT